jgi:hypothetical protein
VGTDSRSATEDVLRRIRGEYTEMPGLCVTLPQAQRLWALDAALCRLALDALVEGGFLRRTDTGQYLRLSDGPVGASPLRTATADRRAPVDTPSSPAAGSELIHASATRRR